LYFASIFFSIDHGGLVNNFPQNSLQ